MKKALFALSAFLLAGLLIQSCKKDSESSVSVADQTIAEDLVSYNDLAEFTDFEVDGQVQENLIDMSVSDRGSCPTVTYAQPIGNWPNTITLDYSPDGCTKDGHTFKGQVVIQQTDKMTTVGAVRTVTFNNFSVDGVQIEGSRVFTNEGPNAAGQPVWSKTAAETFTFPDGTQATFNATHSRTLIEGALTPTHLDNVWSITGNYSGVDRKGNAYSGTITSPLIKRILCPWVVQGTIEFTRNGNTRTLDFGDGTCDRDATLTLNDGTVKSIKIHHHWWK